MSYYSDLKKDMANISGDVKEIKNGVVKDAVVEAGAELFDETVGDTIGLKIAKPIAKVATAIERVQRIDNLQKHAGSFVKHLVP